MSAKTKWGCGAATLLVGALLWTAAHAAKDDATATIRRDSENAKALKLTEPSFQTRDERLKAKPLDWKATSGKPTRRTLTKTEKEALRSAKPESSDGGMPDPHADAEARKLHPDDWKPAPPAGQ